MPTTKMVDMVSWLLGEQISDKVLIMLNQPIANLDLFNKAWTSCKYHVVTDGAANHLREIKTDKYVPDFIIGDFDSISPETRKFYEDLNVPLITDEDQYSTDFMKAMKQSHIRFDEDSSQHRVFLAFGAIGGRVDHTWHSILCLSLAAKRGDQLILVSDQNVTVLLSPGKHKLHTPRDLVGKTCGYAPVEGKAKVTTTGFHWDVCDYEVGFTSSLSTSNWLEKDDVLITTDQPLMFTVELRI